MKNARNTLRTGALATVVALAALLGLAVAATAPQSVQLMDNIAGGSGNNAGRGTIDLFKTRSGTLTGQDLDAFIADNGGHLSFAVDVNENASGLETGRAQGVAVADAWIEATYPGGVVVTFGHAGKYWTETQALIAPRGSTTRAMYYTLLGDAGSNEIAGRKIGTTVYDSTLKVRVDQSLAAATSVKLQVRLLDTDTSLGDPENFYDHSGGYEDLALITRVSARVFDVDLPLSPLIAFRNEAPAMEPSPEGTATLQAEVSSGTTTQTTVDQSATSGSSIASTGATGYQIVAYEDLYPSKGDYDFNDAVIAYRYAWTLDASGNVVSLSGDAYLVARGSNYTHDWLLDVPLPAGVVAQAGTALCQTLDSAAGLATGANACQLDVGSGRLRWTAFAGTRTLLAPASPGSPQRNTQLAEQPVRGPHASFSVALSSPVPLAQLGAADPWLRVIDTGQQVRLSSRDAGNLPFAMVMPAEWLVPGEGVDMGVAYPRLSQFVASGGQQSANWYLGPDAAKVVPWKVLDWAW